MVSWMPVSDAESPLSETTSSRSGAKIVVTESPFNVPEALRLEFRRETNHWVLEFRYLGDSLEIDEPVQRNSLAPGLSVFDGKISHRIYKIEMPDETSVRELIPKIEHVIKEFDRQHKRPKTLGRYQVLIDTLRKFGELLFDTARTQLPASHF